MKRRWLILAPVATALGSSPVRAVQPADATDNSLVHGLRSRLHQSEWLQGEFEQSKQVQGFKRPLISRGDFVIARGRGVLWRTRTPFFSELKLTRDQIHASQGSAPTLNLDTQREPALRLVNEMMFALLSGDVAALSTLFQLDGELLPAQAWRLTLAPRQAAWRQVLKSITLAGERHVHEVRILEASGDLTQIRFSQVREVAPEVATLFD